MIINVPEEKILSFSVNRTAIEGATTVCYLGVMFKYNNTFQAVIKKTVDKLINQKSTTQAGSANDQN